MKQLPILACKYRLWQSVLALSLNEWAFIPPRAILAAARIKLLTASFKTTGFKILSSPPPPFCVYLQIETPNASPPGSLDVQLLLQNPSPGEENSAGFLRFNNPFQTNKNNVTLKISSTYHQPWSALKAPLNSSANLREGNRGGRFITRVLPGPWDRVWITHLFSSSSSSLTLVSILALACFVASSSPFSTSCSPDSWSTLAIKSFFTTFKAFLKGVKGTISKNAQNQQLSIRETWN